MEIKFDRREAMYGALAMTAIAPIDYATAALATTAQLSQNMHESELIMFKSGWEDKPSADWKRWPPHDRLAAKAALRRRLDELGAGAKIVRERSGCSMRTDLSGQPWQLYLAVMIETPA